MVGHRAEERSAKRGLHLITFVRQTRGAIRSSCADVDLYFGSMTSATSGVDLGQTIRLACPSDEDTEIVIVSGQHLTVSSGSEEPVQ